MTAATHLPPLADDDWHTTEGLARRLGLAAGTCRRAMAAERFPKLSAQRDRLPGQTPLSERPLHAHWLGNRYQTKGAVGDAWLNGLDLAAQRRICGCPALAPVPAPRARP